MSNNNNSIKFPEENISEQEFVNKIEQAMNCIEIGSISVGPVKITGEVCPRDRKGRICGYIFGIKIDCIDLDGEDGCTRVSTSVFGDTYWFEACVKWGQKKVTICAGKNNNSNCTDITWLW